MYTQIFFVTSVRGIFLPPQILASGSLKAFGAKIPTPFFFMAAAIFLPFSFNAVLPAAFFVALIAAFVAFVVVVATVVFVDFVIAIKRLECKHALSLEPK